MSGVSGIRVAMSGLLNKHAMGDRYIYMYSQPGASPARRYGSHMIFRSVLIRAISLHHAKWKEIDNTISFAAVPAK